MNAYELQRLENIRQNQTLLAALDLDRLGIQNDEAKPDSRRPKKRQKVENAPSRTSARIAAGTRPSLKHGTREIHTLTGNSIPKTRIKTNRKVKRKMDEEELDVDPAPARPTEKLRAPWADWKAVAPLPTRDEDGRFHFDDYPSFTPNKSPEEVLREGCFGGSYYRPLRSHKLGIVVEDDYKELPDNWASGLDVTRYLTSPNYDPDVNKFKVTCGQSIEEWEAAGWIAHEYDIRGWFQWYTRFYQGRRCQDDERQVSRWRKCVGETGRWRRMLLKKYMALGVREVFDDGADEDTPEVSPVMHQTCHHWAFEVRQHVLDDFWGTERRKSS